MVLDNGRLLLTPDEAATIIGDYFSVRKDRVIFHAKPSMVKGAILTEVEVVSCDCRKEEDDGK